MKNDKVFYLTSRHGNCGSNVMFHNKNGSGYGTDLDNLELFTIEDAQIESDHDIKSLPLLKSEVDKLAVMHVDMQHLDKIENEKHCLNKFILVVSGKYDGNDIAFATPFGYTFDLCLASSVSLKQAKELALSNHEIWSLDYLTTIARRTFQAENINTRKMITGAGIKYKKPRKPRPTTGKTRWNCPGCGKIHWQFNPYNFDGCNDIHCS